MNILPIRGYSEGLLAVDKRPMRVGQVLAKNGYPCMEHKLYALRDSAEATNAWRLEAWCEGISVYLVVFAGLLRMPGKFFKVPGGSCKDPGASGVLLVGSWKVVAGPWELLGNLMGLFGGV